MPPPVATTTTAHSTWHPVYTVLLHRALVKYRLQHVVSGTDVRTFRVTVAAPTTPPSANIDASARPRDIGVRLAYRLHEPPTPNAPFTLPFYDGTRLVVTPITDFVRKSRFRSAHVAVDPAQPPTRSWQDFEPARSAICTAYAEAVTGAQLAQYQRAQGDALPPDSAPLLTNPRFPSLPLTLTRGTALQRVCYDQLDYTCGDWSDLWYHAMYGSYTRMRAPTVRTPGPVAPRVKAAMATLRPLYFGDRSPYVTLSPATTHATLSYVFQHLQKGVFVRFRGGTLDAFVPFCRHNFNNTVYDQYYLAGSPHDRAQLQEMRRLEAALRTFDTRHRDPDTASPTDKALYTRQLGRLLELETVCAQRYARAHRARHPTDLKANPNRRQWLPNNHFVNQAVYLNNPNVHHFRYLLTTLAAHRTLPDAEFVLNLRDHPVLRGTYQATTDTTTVYNPYPDLETDPHAPPTLLRTVHGGLAPILSHTGKDGYSDIALPTIDDIQHYSQRVFLDQCSTNYIDEASKTPFQPTNNRPDSLWVDWHAKTVTKAVFRGSGTGRGTTPVVNQRLAVWRLAHTPAYCDILDVELTSLNRKPKVIAGDAGLQYLDTKDVQAVCQSRIDRKRHFLGLVERSRYKYVLCLDGQTRADRMLNEMRTGSLVILPTPPLPHGGHRLWLEAFLTPLSWERDLAAGHGTSAAVVKQKGYTHVTVDDVAQIGDVVRWLVSHDDVAAQVVTNVKTTLFHPVTGLCARRTPETCFLYDYMEAIVRLISQRHTHSARRPFTLLSPRAPSSKVVGVVVGFRDTFPGGGPRTAQLRAFRDYFRCLFPPEWAHDVVVVEQPTVVGDRAAFDAWWLAAFGADREEATVAEVAQALQDRTRAPWPPCLVRNVGHVGGDVHLALGVSSSPLKRGESLRRVWTRDEAYRRVGEEKFNLGRCKNQGYRVLRAKYGKRLSHVVFTDIDMLPDHELAPWYAHVPASNEVIALSHRGTVYDAVTVDNLPLRSLEASARDDWQRKRGRFASRQRTRSRLATRRRRRGGTTTTASRRTRGHARSPRPDVRHNRHTMSGVASHLGKRARSLAKLWTRRKFARFLGAAFSIHPTLFEAINGYPNSFWGWGGEDDALVTRLSMLTADTGRPVKYTVPSQGRLIDLEMAEPVTLEDKLGARVKEQLKHERLVADRRRWRSDGVTQLGEAKHM